EARPFLLDQLAESGAGVIDRVIHETAEGRLQLGDALQRGFRTRIFFAVQRQAAVVAIDRNQALGETAFLDGDGGAALRLDTEGIDVLTAESFFLGDDVGGEADVAHRVDFAQVQVTAVDVAAGRIGGGHRHHFDATGDDQI